MHGRRTSLLVAMAALAALTLTACGGSDEGGTASGSGSGSGSTPAQAYGAGSSAATEAEASSSPPVALQGDVNAHGTTTVSGDSLEVELDDYYFEPTYIQGQPGQTVELELHNEGTASHTFTIDDQDVDEQLAADGSATVEVTIPDSRFVRFYCRFHAGQGMQGALVAS